MKWEPEEADMLKRSYYSIQSIIAFGRCHCSGHAAKCKITDIEEDDNVRF